MDYSKAITETPYNRFTQAMQKLLVKLSFSRSASESVRVKSSSDDWFTITAPVIGFDPSSLHKRARASFYVKTLAVIIKALATRNARNRQDDRATIVLPLSWFRKTEVFSFRNRTMLLVYLQDLAEFLSRFTIRREPEEEERLLFLDAHFDVASDSFIMMTNELDYLKCLRGKRFPMHEAMYQLSPMGFCLYTYASFLMKVEKHHQDTRSISFKKLAMMLPVMFDQEGMADNARHYQSHHVGLKVSTILPIQEAIQEVNQAIGVPDFLTLKVPERVNYREPILDEIFLEISAKKIPFWHHQEEVRKTGKRHQPKEEKVIPAERRIKEA